MFPSLRNQAPGYRLGCRLLRWPWSWVTRWSMGLSMKRTRARPPHTWQILMVGQLPFVAYFIVRWLPKQTQEALQVLAILAVTWLANFAAVFWLT